jgi:hypothetical protein
MPLENKFKSDLVRELHDLYPEAIILKNDAASLQGIPDILILIDEFWAVLETKKNRTAHRQPNQEYYVEKLNDMSFASFIYPENKEEVLDELQQAYRARRPTRLSRSK